MLCVLLFKHPELKGGYHIKFGLPFTSRTLRGSQCDSSPRALPWWLCYATIPCDLHHMECNDMMWLWHSDIILLVPGGIKGQPHAWLQLVGHMLPSWTTYECFQCNSLPNWHLTALSYTMSVLLSLVLWGLLCSRCQYMVIRPNVLVCCAIHQHSSVLCQYNPTSDRSITPRNSKNNQQPTMSRD